jgi:hypothetical protein
MDYPAIIRKQALVLAIPAALVAGSTAGLWVAAANVGARMPAPAGLAAGRGGQGARDAPARFARTAQVHPIVRGFGARP